MSLIKFIICINVAEASFYDLIRKFFLRGIIGTLLAISVYFINWDNLFLMYVFKTVYFLWNASFDNSLDGDRFRGITHNTLAMVISILSPVELKMVNWTLVRSISLSSFTLNIILQFIFGYTPKEGLYPFEGLVRRSQEYSARIENEIRNKNITFPTPMPIV